MRAPSVAQANLNHGEVVVQVAAHHHRFAQPMPATGLVLGIGPVEQLLHRQPALTGPGALAELAEVEHHPPRNVEIPAALLSFAPEDT